MITYRYSRYSSTTYTTTDTSIEPTTIVVTDSGYTGYHAEAHASRGVYEEPYVCDGWKDKLIQKKPWCYYTLQHEHNLPDRNRKVESNRRLISAEIISNRNTIRQQSRRR